MRSIKHTFSLYFESFSSLLEHTDDKIITLVDKELCNRIFSILRLKKGDSFILFDRYINAQARLNEISKKKCVVEVIEKHENKQIMPEITVLLPLLKRDDLERALSDITAAGITAIQLVITEKVQRKWGGRKEYDRLEKIIIAAAEQSKCYHFTRLHEPVFLNEYFSIKNEAVALFADPTGQPFFDVMLQLKDTQPQKMIICVGPEGDLTTQEKQYLIQNNFIFCNLTPTVLRTRYAIALLVGAIRSTMY